MSNYPELTTMNWIDVAQDYYDPRHMIEEDEFEEDLQRITYIKRLFRKYVDKGLLNERAVLNHIIILGNVFDRGFLVRMLFFRIEEEEFQPILKTFLVFLYMCRQDHMPKVPVDMRVAERLRNI